MSDRKRSDGIIPLPNLSTNTTLMCPNILMTIYKILLNYQTAATTMLPHQIKRLKNWHRNCLLDMSMMLRKQYKDWLPQALAREAYNETQSIRRSEVRLVIGHNSRLYKRGAY
jgi:hypothetical protein